MEHLRRAETNSTGGVMFEMEISRNDNFGQGESSTDAGLLHPGFEFYFIISALVAIPILKRK